MTEAEANIVATEPNAPIAKDVKLPEGPPADEMTCDRPKTDIVGKENGSKPVGAKDSSKEAKKVDESIEDKNEEDKDETAGAVIDDDRTWYGKGPPETVLELVSGALGLEVSSLFNQGYMQMNGAEESVPRILAATDTFVKALKAVPEDMQTTGGFGELSFAHGRALALYVEIQSKDSTAVSSKILKAVQAATSSVIAQAVSADDAAVEQGEDDDDEDDEDDTGKDGDEEDMEASWTQLEVARVIFSQQGWTGREAECRVTIGDLLLSCDEGKQAGSEFEAAAKLFTETRRKAECYYKRYLSLRNFERSEAITALKEAVKIYESVDGPTDVVTDMRAELDDIITTAKESGMGGLMNGNDKEQVIEVVSVRPKRKRDVMAGGKTEGGNKDSGKDGAGANGEVSGDGSEEAKGKKARIEESAATPGKTETV